MAQFIESRAEGKNLFSLEKKGEDSPLKGRSSSKLKMQIAKKPQSAESGTKMASLKEVRVAEAEINALKRIKVTMKVKKHVRRQIVVE